MSDSRKVHECGAKKSIKVKRLSQKLKQKQRKAGQGQGSAGIYQMSGDYSGWPEFSEGSFIHRLNLNRPATKRHGFGRYSINSLNLHLLTCK